MTANFNGKTTARIVQELTKNIQEITKITLPDKRYSIETITEQFNNIITVFKSNPNNEWMANNLSYCGRFSFHDEKASIKDKTGKYILIQYSQKKKQKIITIHIEIFRNPKLLPTFFAYEIIYQIIEKAFLPTVKQRFIMDLAMGLVYDIILDKRTSKEFLQKWKQVFRPLQENKFITYDLMTYITAINDFREGFFFKMFFTYFIEQEDYKGKARLHYNYPFHILPVTLGILNPLQLKVLHEIITHPTENDDKSISNRLQLPESRVARARKVLESTFLLRKKVQYNLESINLLNFHGIFITPKGKGEEFKKIEYAMTRSISVFHGTEDIVFWSGYVPNSPYAKKQFYEWRNQLLIGKELQVENKDPVIELTKKPLIGIENQSMRYEIMRPELYNAELKFWELGEMLSDKAINQRNVFPREVPQFIWDKTKCEIIKEMIKRPFSKRKTEIIKKIKGKTQKKLEIFNNIITEKTIQEINVMPFYGDLLETIVIIKLQQEKYLRYLKTFASRVPLSLSVFIPDPGFTISFLGLPILKSRTFILDLLQHFQDAIIANYPSNIETALPLELRCEEKNWKFTRFPQISVHYSYSKKV